VFSATGQTKVECSRNNDELYNRAKIIKQLARILSKSIPERKLLYGTNFDISDDNRSPAGFFIYDLTDTTDKDISSSGCIEFKEGHVYHFAPFDANISLSHILYLEKGGLKVFKSVNCDNRGDRLTAVISFLSKKLPMDKDKEAILGRVKNYKQFGKYYSMDNYSAPICDGV
jgi:hypothetical protein